MRSPRPRGLPALLVAYGLVRLGLFVVSALLLLLLGVTGLLLVAGALLASSVLAYAVLRPYRQALDRAWADRRTRSR